MMNCTTKKYYPNTDRINITDQKYFIALRFDGQMFPKLELKYFDEMQSINALRSEASLICFF